MAFGGFGADLEFALIFEGVDHASSAIESIGRALESVISTTADFQTSLVQVQNNTTLTSANMDAMRVSVLSMGRESGAPLDDLAQAFMRATNLGFDMADATQVVQKGMESAVSTGSKTSDVVNTLALQMHEFGLQASQAGEAMNVLHLAAALGNSTLEEFATQTTKATSMAANLGIPLVQVDAALSALTRHESLTDANTQIAGFFSKLVNPAKETITELEHLSKATGVDLVTDFTAVGFAAKGLPGVLDDLRKATGGNVTEMLKLIPATRGGLAEMILLGTGTKDYTDILRQLNAAMAGETDPTTAAYQRTLHTFNQELAIVKTDLTEFVMDVGQPVLIGIQPELTKLITYMNTHQKDITAFGTAIGHDIGGAFTIITTGIPPLIVQLGKLTDAFGAFAKQSKETGDSLKQFTTDSPQNFLLHPPGTSANAPGILGDFLGSAGNFLLHPPGTSQSAPGTLLDALLHGPGNQSWPGLGNGLSGPPVPPGAGVGLGHNLYGPVLLPRLPASDGGGAAYSAGRGGFPAGGDYYTGTTPPGPAPQTAAQAAAAQAALVAAARAALRDAQDRLSIDLLKNAPQTQLLGDIAIIMKDFANPALKNTPTAVELENLNLLRQIESNTKASVAAQTALTTAQQRLQIDQLKGASHTVLMGDIRTIMADFSNPALKNTPTAIELEHLQLLAQIKSTTTATATHAAILAGPSLAYTRPDQAGYQQTIASFGLPQRDSQQQIIALLRQQLAAAEQRAVRDEELIALLRDQLREQRTGTQASVITAGNTSRLVAAGSHAPAPYRDPRARAGTAHP